MPTDEPGERPAAPLSLQLLFPSAIRPDPVALAASLHALHRELATATVEIDPGLAAQGAGIGLVRWGRHVVKVVWLDAPMPARVVETCVAPAHYAQDLKRRARAHRAHALLYHVGEEPSPRERYVALAAVAVALAPPGSFLLNEAARTSLPADALSAMTREGDRLEPLRTLPVLLLYAGFVKYEVPGVRGVWMRTYGNHLLGLPDLAMLADGHHQGQKVFDLFSNVLNYVLDTGAVLDAGHTMEVGPDFFLKLRAPRPEEDWLQSDGQMLVAEMAAGS